VAALAPFAPRSPAGAPGGGGARDHSFLGGQADALAHELTLVRMTPASSTSAFWLDYFRRTHTPTPFASAAAVAWRITRRKFRFTIAARGWGDRRRAGGIDFRLPQTGPGRPRCAPTRTPLMIDVQAAHPDWIAVDAQGQPRRHLGVAGDVGDLRAGSLQF